MPRGDRPIGFVSLIAEQERAACERDGRIAHVAKRDGTENGKKERDLAGKGTVQSPQIVLPASLEPALLMLYGALTIEELWKASVTALRTAMAIHDLSMALFPAEKSAGTLRVSNPVPNLKLYAAKIDAMSPVHAVLARDPGLVEENRRLHRSG